MISIKFMNHNKYYMVREEFKGIISLMLSFIVYRREFYFFRNAKEQANGKEYKKFI